MARSKGGDGRSGGSSFGRVLSKGMDTAESLNAVARGRQLRERWQALTASQIEVINHWEMGNWGV